MEVAVSRAFCLLWLMLLSLSLPATARDAPKVSLTPEQQAALVQARKQTVSVALLKGDFVAKHIFDRAAKAYKLALDYRYQDSFADVLAAVDDGRAQLAANITFTEERAQRFHFSSPSNIEYTYLFAREPITITQLDGKTVTVAADTIFDDLIQPYVDNLSVIKYHTIDQALTQLDSGQADALVGVIDMLAPLIGHGFQATLLNDQLAILPVSLITGLSQERHLLDALAELFDDGGFQRALRQRIERHIRTLFRQRLQQMVADSDLDPTRIYQVKIENLPPYGIYPSSLEPDQVRGIAADAIGAACDEIGLHCQLNSRSDESWSAMFGEFRQGRVDILAPLVITEQRQAFTHYTRPFYTENFHLVTRNGYKAGVYKHVSELVGERIGVIEGSFQHQFLMRRLPGKKWVPYANTQRLIDGLRRHEVDFITLSDTYLDRAYARGEHLDLERAMALGALGQYQIAIGIRKDAEGAQLATLFDLAFNLLDLKAIANRYVEPVNFQAFYRQGRSTNRWLIGSFSALGVLALIIIVRLYRLTRRDQLTGLHNRLTLDSRHQRGLKADQLLLYIEIIHLKEINATNGHRTGDTVLRNYADTIRRIWSGEAYRLGGNGFVLIGTYRPAQIQSILRQLQYLRMQCPHSGVELTIRASIGIFDGRIPHSSLDELLSLTDLAIYQDKKHAVTQSVLVDQTLLEASRAHLSQRKALDTAIKMQQLTAHYQPIWDLAAGRIVGIECLSRWPYQDRLLCPADFLEATPVADLEYQLDQVTLRCAELTYWSLRYHGLVDDSFIMSVNLSASSLRQHLTLLDQLQALSIPPRHLLLEVKENLVLDPVHSNAINKLLDADYTLILDDFGASYTSLQLLQISRLNQFKVHRDLLPLDIAHNKTSQSGLLSLVSMLRQLGKQVIIKGVETAEQDAYLRNHDLSLVQGFFYAQPMNQQQLIPYLSSHAQQPAQALKTG